MQIKLKAKDWYLYIDSCWDEYEATDIEYQKITSWLYNIKHNWVFVFEDNLEALDRKRLQDESIAKTQKSKEINDIATLSDQLNLLASVLYRLTEWTADKEIQNARKTFEDIQTILSK